MVTEIIVKSLTVGLKLSLGLGLTVIVGVGLWCYLKPDLDKLCDFIKKVKTYK